MRMRIGMRSRLATNEICKALLLAVASVAIVIPTGDVALGQGNTEIAAQVPLFTAIDLTPSGFTDSRASGISSGQQAGSGVPSIARPHHTLLWRGTGASAVDLNPSGFDESWAFGICGGQQVGYGSREATGRLRHGLLWRGSAASVVDLNPSGFDDSEIVATSGDQQVGDGAGPATGDKMHALLWRGTAASVVDLHPRGFIWSEASGVSGGQQVGYGVQQVGSGAQTAVGDDHALLWRGSAASVVDLTPNGFGSSIAASTNGDEQVGRTGLHAVLWRGSAASMVDLHAFLPPGFRFSGAAGIDASGDVVGYASPTGGPAPDSHALLCKRNVPKPGTSRHNTTGC